MGTLIETLTSAGYEVRFRTVQAVRNAKDVTLVVVDIDNNFTGEGITAKEAFQAAVLALQTRIAKRSAKDTTLLAALDAAQG